ncbi:alpha/beta hydrolase [Agromyces protaetiae]|uniref:Alpha/beta hydrolase n=1 Tax=Agromyces protaetiae TaxID=2509455 RepID=A0A4P6F8G0_9MICO|nr:alpha/beta hydrolase [Agromyces protaetiae]QAY72122.1 alpha/beta hydrolase [Agromyces protaetiae]
MTVLLLHGLGNDRNQPLELFSPVLAALGERAGAGGGAGPIVAIDVRAHGSSPIVGEPGDFALARLAAEVAAAARDEVTEASGFAEAAELAPFTVIGISMGAAIGLRIALDGLLPVERAVFVRPAFGDRSLPDNLRAFPVIGQRLLESGPEGVAEFVETSLYRLIEHESPAGGRGLLAQFAAPFAEERAMRLVEIPRNRAFRDDAELAGVSARGTRSLVVGARRDPVHPFALAERWAGGLGATLETAPARDDGLAAQTAVVRDAVGRWLDATA